MPNQEFPPIRDLFVNASKRAAALEERPKKCTGCGDAPDERAHDAVLAEAISVNNDLLQIIERLAMAASSIHASQRLFVLKAAPANESGESSEYSTALGNAALIEEAFSDEIAFVREVNRELAAVMLKQQGIDPADHEAVKRHVEQNLNGQDPDRGT